MEVSEREYMTTQVNFGRADVPQDAPITMHITDSLGSLGSQAEEIVSRLYILKDRLFGSEITKGTADGANAPRPSAHCFQAATNMGINDLRRSLSVIDQLSLEIANRL